MIYITGITHYTNFTEYDCFESNTDSHMTISTDQLKTLLIKFGDNIVNAKLINNQISTEHCINSMISGDNRHRSGAHYTLLSKISKDNFKLVNSNGITSYIGELQLRRYIQKKDVVNCKIEVDKIVSNETYETRNDESFNRSIAEKYKIYLAKTSLLGHDMSFDYDIEGTQVKLQCYTGTSKQVIVPKFVTIIMKEAFTVTGIEKITLDNGITHIGEAAFQRCNLREITIPETVELKCPWAFYENKRLVGENDEYKDTIKILSSKTVILDEIR